MSRPRPDGSPIPSSATWVVVTWLWAMAGPLLLAGAVVGLWGIDLQTARQWWERHQYAQAYVETVFVGLLPLALTVWRGDAFGDYGVRRRGFPASLSLSLALAAAFRVYAFATTGVWFGHSDLPFVAFPLNVWYGVLGIAANGPLEVFFVFWLIRRTERLFADGDLRWSKGLLVTILLVGLVHVISTRSVPNALTVAVLFLALGLIYERTGNALGPMVGWTLMNGMTWTYVGLLCGRGVAA